MVTVPLRTNRHLGRLVLGRRPAEPQTGQKHRHAAAVRCVRLVTQIATALLNSAPYLDLMVEFGLVAQQGD